MNRFEEELDALNEETFGDNDYYDWETEHEKFLLEQTKDDNYENSLEQFSFDKWQNDLDKPRNLHRFEETVEKIIENDEDNLDPAIVNSIKNTSSKVIDPFSSYGILNDSHLNKENNKINNFNIKNKQYEPMKINRSQASLALDMIEKFFTMSVVEKKNLPKSNRQNNNFNQNYPADAAAQFNQRIPGVACTNFGPINFSVPPPHFTKKQEFLNNLSSIKSPQLPQSPTNNMNNQINNTNFNNKPNCSYDRVPVEYNKPFDPITDIWITRLEKAYILKIKNIFLQTATPYIHDYYYSITWLRKITKRKQEIAEMNDSINTFSPLLAIPPPITVEDIDEEHNYHNLESQFVITDLEKEQEDNEAGDPTITNKGCEEELENPIVQSPLGQFTKSNYRTQRIISELSVVCAVKKKTKKKSPLEIKDQCDESLNATTSLNLTLGDLTQHEQSLRDHRERTILLAQIERVFSIVLNLDEIDFALVRLTEKNEDFHKLLNHKSKLLDRLLSNFFLRPANDHELSLIGLKRDCQVDDENLKTGYHVPDLNILSVKKGCRVFLQVLPYLSNSNLQLSFAYFIANFTKISRIVTIPLEELSDTFYAVFKPLTIRIEDISKFLELCLPEASEFLIGDQSRANSAIEFLFTSLGISFVLNLLNLFACQLNKSNQEDFINFCVRLMKCLSRSDEERPVPQENFPVLLNILPQYLNSVLKGHFLSTAGLITSNELNMLISLISSARQSNPENISNSSV